MQDESGEGSENASKSDASTIVEPAQDVVHLSSSLMTPIAAYAARPLISVLQNGSWAVGLQVSEVLYRIEAPVVDIC